MSKHLCAHCGKKFDAYYLMHVSDPETKRRFYHAECYEKIGGVTD